MQSDRTRLFLCPVLPIRAQQKNFTLPSVLQHMTRLHTKKNRFLCRLFLCPAAVCRPRAFPVVRPSTRLLRCLPFLPGLPPSATPSAFRSALPPSFPLPPPRPASCPVRPHFSLLALPPPLLSRRLRRRARPFRLLPLRSHSHRPV